MTTRLAWSQAQAAAALVVGQGLWSPGLPGAWVKQVDRLGGLPLAPARDLALAVQARTAGLGRAVVEEELRSGRRLLVGRGPRRKLHVFPSESYLDFMAATRDRQPVWRRRLAPAPRLANARAQVLSACAEFAAVRVSDLRLLLGHGWSAAVIDWMLAAGDLVRLPPESGHMRVALASRRGLEPDWLDAADPAEARRRLVSRYLRQVGAASLVEIAVWTGLSSADCGHALDELGVVEVGREGRSDVAYALPPAPETAGGPASADAVLEPRRLDGRVWLLGPRDPLFVASGEERLGLPGGFLARRDPPGPAIAFWSDADRPLSAVGDWRVEEDRETVWISIRVWAGDAAEAVTDRLSEAGLAVGRFVSGPERRVQVEIHKGAGPT